MTMEKITRATFLYMDPTGPDKAQNDKAQNAQCKTCRWFIDDKKRCVQHRKSDEIAAGDSCCLYVEGPNATGAEPEGLTNPEISGLVSRQVRCQNCRFFDDETEPKDHCDFYTQL